jgi:hypothetical protein
LFNRKIAAAALAATVLLGTSACSITRDIPTLQQYSPSEGVDGDTKSVALRNFLVLTNGTSAELIGSAINTTNKNVNFSLSYEGTNGSETANYSLKPQQKLDFGYNGNAGLAAASTLTPGQNSTLKVTEGSQTISLNAQILDGTLSQYTDLVNSLGAAK